MRHRKEIQRIAKEHGYSFPFHDFVKMINIAIFGDKIATKLHRKFSRHHAHKYLYKYKAPDWLAGVYRDIPNKIEAAFDWESARFTKPDKPWKKYYSDIDMESTLKILGFWEE